MKTRGFALSAVAALALSGCATAPKSQLEAALPEIAMDNALRDMIRTYVREVAGPDYLVDPSDLERSNTLVATNRGRDVAMGQPRLVPDRTFRLWLVRDDGAETCRLEPEDGGSDPLILGLGACTPLSPR